MMLSIQAQLAVDFDRQNSRSATGHLPQKTAHHKVIGGQELIQKNKPGLCSLFLSKI